MSIRRQSIISTGVIYTGFFIGLLNIYFFTKQGRFSEAEFGLYNAFIAIATMIMALASFAMPAFIYKFYPYYKAHVPDKKNDQLSLALLVSTIGFVLVLVAGFLFKGLVVKKYQTNAPDIITYYPLIFLLGFGLLCYTVLEAYTWQLRKSVFTNFLKEVLWRLYITVLLVLYMTGIIPDFSSFVWIFSFSFPFIALVLLLYLIGTGQIHFTFRMSKVTRRFSGSIIRLCSFVYAGSMILTISQVFDSLVIASVLDDALTQLAIYSVAQNMAAVIQVPQRGIVAASIAHLSQAWKDKNMELIRKIYQRSSINQLLFASCFYSLLILNFTDAVNTFGLKGSYLQAYYALILLGLCKIVDMGTGVNAQIIATSTWWRFEMISGIVLLAVMLPLSYILTKHYGISGAAAAQLISITIYNMVRIIFLWKKFKLFPFTLDTIWSVLLAVASYAAAHYACLHIHGIPGMFARSILFLLLFAGGAIGFRLSPDIMPVLQSLKKRFIK
ncbi:MAG: polysaccharide biosynthesis C-terminal domain-containing protein [Bacteroidetes bacterium]|nr:polysaccharide biosynthesis C-terminal domain-containing protein [Bacteroidota bacterium]